MRLPPQVSAVRRDNVYRPMPSASGSGSVPAAHKATGESIVCFGGSPNMCTCLDSGTPVGAACCKNNESCQLSSGVCVCS